MKRRVHRIECSKGRRRVSQGSLLGRILNLLYTGDLLLEIENVLSHLQATLPYRQQGQRYITLAIRIIIVGSKFEN